MYPARASAAFFACIVALATLVFSAFYTAEQWSALDAFYFTIVTFTTIGFGDFSPDPHPSWFAAVFITCTFFGLGITATLVRAASDKDFDIAATARGLAPDTTDAALSAWHGLQTALVDRLGLPDAWRPVSLPVMSQCTMSAVPTSTTSTPSNSSAGS